MEQYLLSPKNDLVFKLIFGSQKNTDILADFLQAILDIPPDDYEKITIVDPHFRLDRADGKFGILDLKVHTKSGMIIDVEIQAFSVPNMRERIVYYSSKLVTGQLGAGEDYGLIKKTITIVITDFILIHDSGRYHNKYMFYDKDSGSQFTDIVEIHTLELPKIPVQADSSPLWNWLKFFIVRETEDFMTLTKKNPCIKKAVGILMELSQDQRTRMLAESREKAWRDEQNRVFHAREEGKQEGIVLGKLEGRQEERLEIVRKMKLAGMSAEQIAAFTGLPLTDVAMLP